MNKYQPKISEREKYYMKKIGFARYDYVKYRESKYRTRPLPRLTWGLAKTYYL